MPVESCGVVRPETLAPRQVLLGKINVERFAWRIEKIGIIGAHFVGIDQQMWIPRVYRAGQSAHFRLSLYQPIPIQVEKIMIPASLRPQTLMLHRLVVGA